MFKFKTPPKKGSLAAENERLRDEMAKLAREVVDTKVYKLQLAFWHNHSKELENQVHMFQRLYLDALRTMREVSDAPIEFDAKLREAKDAFDAALQTEISTSSLILAVSLSSTQQTEVLSRLIPSLAPALAMLDRLPSKAQANIIGVPGLDAKGASDGQSAQAAGERTQLPRPVSKSP